MSVLNPHRPFSSAEPKKRDDLTKYLDCCSEDELIEEVLLPLYRQLGLHRITAGGPKDKALEYGKAGKEGQAGCQYKGPKAS